MSRHKIDFHVVGMRYGCRQFQGIDAPLGTWYSLLQEIFKTAPTRLQDDSDIILDMPNVYTAGSAPCSRNSFGISSFGIVR
jgi:hypothetical protein